MIDKRRVRLLAVLLVGLALAFNFPVLTVVEAIQAATGISWMPLYIFGVWALAILAAALLLEQRGR